MLGGGRLVNRNSKQNPQTLHFIIEDNKSKVP